MAVIDLGLFLLLRTDALEYCYMYFYYRYLNPCWNERMQKEIWCLMHYLILFHD